MASFIEYNLPVYFDKPQTDSVLDETNPEQIYLNNESDSLNLANIEEIKELNSHLEPDVYYYPTALAVQKQKEAKINEQKMLVSCITLLVWCLFIK